MNRVILTLSLLFLAGCQSTPKTTVIAPPSTEQPIQWVKKGNVYYLELKTTE